MATFPALKVYHCQFCSQIFVTESARRNHNNMEFRDFALAHARMDSVGGANDQAGGARDVMGEASGQAGGSRDVMEGEMDEAMDEASPPKKPCSSSVMGTEGASTTPIIRSAPHRDPQPYRPVFPQQRQRCRCHHSSRSRTISPYRIVLRRTSRQRQRRTMRRNATDEANLAGLSQ